jgi:site-specific DNA-adenine methylase
VEDLILAKDDIWKIDLDYYGENNVASFFNSDGMIHPYPAKAVPEVVNSLLLKISELINVKTVLDPFVGSGTVALESKYLGFDFYGSDLNPLSVLISKTKSLTVRNPQYVEKQLSKFTSELLELYSPNNINCFTILENISYWFKEENIKQLHYIKNNINAFLKRSTSKYKETYALILLTAFSSTIRISSLTRNGEFKLYRMSPSDIKKHDINAVVLFQSKVQKLLNMLEHANDALKTDSLTQIFLRNAKDISYLDNKKVDVILTSPPYGDSQSTVAYGEFSRLSLQWMSDLLSKYLNINVYSNNCDQFLLGGKKSKINIDVETLVNNSQTLSMLIDQMHQVVKIEIENLENALFDLFVILEQLEHGIKVEIKNEILLKLIQERVRLDVYRRVNEKGIFTNKKTKGISKSAAINFISDLFNSNTKRRYRRINQLKIKLFFVRITLIRKIKAQPRRIKEVTDFFRDLYQVVIETDRVLVNGGVQAWIVGHRTVLGKVNINLVGILENWFESLGYTKITTLERQYSFKRLPHHINSTVTRYDEIKTMMQEHILVVTKIK